MSAAGHAVRRDKPRGAGNIRLAGWLALAATPTFAIMALLTTVSADGATATLCTGGNGFALGGMAQMYVLMSAFHLAPWLRLVSGRVD